MPRAVRFDHYGGIDVLEVVEVPPPAPAAGQVRVRVKAAGINPGEASIREGRMHERWPAHFPSGQGSDLAGVVDAIGAGVDSVSVGDEVIGFSDERSSQAELVVLPAEHLARAPGRGVLGGRRRAVRGRHDRLRGRTRRRCRPRARPSSSRARPAVSARWPCSWLAAPARASSAWPARTTTSGSPTTASMPVHYGDGIADRIRAAATDGVDAFIDTFGGGYVAVALELGVPPERIDTIIDFEAAARYGVKTEGHAAAANAQVLAELAALVDAGELEVPIAHAYPLDQVREAYRELERRHTRGKIVLVP